MDACIPSQTLAASASSASLTDTAAIIEFALLSYPSLLHLFFFYLFFCPSVTHCVSVAVLLFT